MNKEAAYKLGVELALSDAGITKEALDPRIAGILSGAMWGAGAGALLGKGPAKDRWKSIMAGGLGGAALGGLGGHALHRLWRNPKVEESLGKLTQEALNKKFQWWQDFEPALF